MTRQEKDVRLQELNEQQLKLAAIMSQSDAHASKCIKLGLTFKDAYPDEYEAYTKAREQYNQNEVEIETMNSTGVESEAQRRPESL